MSKEKKIVEEYSKLIDLIPIRLEENGLKVKDLLNFTGMSTTKYYNGLKMKSFIPIDMEKIIDFFEQKRNIYPEGDEFLGNLDDEPNVPYKK
jgi:hypothetical protein